MWCAAGKLFQFAATKCQGHQRTTAVAVESEVQVTARMLGMLGMRKAGRGELLSRLEGKAGSGNWTRKGGSCLQTRTPDTIILSLGPHCLLTLLGLTPDIELA